ncbi:Putative tartrate transporter [Paraburkholderia domus]|jgi:Sugar phosphate permease|uniref:Tartrate transporter n=1 Tax=Paraburkholderia domus TaxID=2793075 RepID=A0A9N8MKB0_9BURK|nr:MFS transporter [Paraburkholderia domus]MBK5053640.1 MFS transporter [Burkholderia sp. R-70006]MBK5064923.1 MFS transporter [Burkholderia sp. R-70199]MBK5090910.1 MFS transporter [Burkholderia sp. R-69927]MBK5125045.1 MFS transporter [Burkholderia sp. R-69980]MBK5168551.1 MFS transporter [Burkholderia sp. R-70211]MBK5183860.1 MFS transporter [Burkholderia sp. R-69749]MCI0144307.1 MFS transporter [Paraburkholderia sediminicola]
MTTYTSGVKETNTQKERDSDTLYRKIFWRLVPVIFISQVFAFLDRVNVGFARSHMTHDLGLTAAQYGFSAGVFFLGAMLLEVPSNLYLQRIGARKTLSRIMVLWGLASAATMLVKTPQQFIIARFVLGLCEAGFWPGVLLYLTYWFPAERRAQATAACLLAPIAAGTIAGPISGLILGSMEGVAGLHGWQWMFVLEGLPACLLGILVFLRLPDSPQTVTWLSNGERTQLLADLGRGASAVPETAQWASLGRTGWRKLALFSLVLFCLLSGIFLNVFWLPTVIHESGVNGDLRIGLYSMLPYLVSGVATVLVSRHSDRHRERRWHFAGAMLVGACGIIVLTFGHASPFMALLGICLLGGGLSPALPIFWTLPPVYLPKAALPGAIALINVIGGLGALVGPSLVGTLRDRTGSMQLSMAPFVVVLVIGAVALAVGTRTRS